MKVYRAHDGRAIDVNQPLSHFHRLDDLLDCFSLATGIPSDSIICMTVHGQQLKDEVIDTIIAQENNKDLEFFVFNREFLYADADALALDFAEVPTLEPPAQEIDVVDPPTPRSLEAVVSGSSLLLSYVRAHVATCQELHARLEAIQRSTSVALLNLLAHSGSVATGATTLRELANKELGRMRELLDGHERDLQVLSMVGVNARLLTGAGGDSKGSKTNKERTLGDYVSRVKMGAVADACGKVYSELRESLAGLEESSMQLSEDTAALRAEVEGTNIAPSTETLDEAVQALARADKLCTFISSACSPDANGWPVADKLDTDTLAEVARGAEELLLLDEVAREALRRLAADRNDIVARGLHLLQDISALQSDYADLGAGLAAVDADLHSNKVDGFRHLARLKNMLWAYGATVVEVVRRREFSRHFLAKSQALAELMAKLSATERKRRAAYRGDVVGQLPWEVKGMEDAPPSLEISTTQSSGEGVAELGREDIAALFALLDAVDQSLSQNADGSDAQTPSPIPEIKAALEQLMARLDDLDADFVSLVDKSLLARRGSESDEDDSSESASQPRPRANGRHPRADSAERQRLEQELQRTRQDTEERVRIMTTEHEAALAALREESVPKTELQARDEELDAVRRKEAEANEVVESLKADLETEAQRRLNLEDEVSMLRRELNSARRETNEARQEGAEESERAAELEMQLSEVQSELVEARAARMDASSRIEALLSEGSSVERELSQAQVRMEELLSQLSAARSETREARDALAEAETARDKLIRSHKAEADGDRAILEENLRARQAELQVMKEEVTRRASEAHQAIAEAELQREAAEMLQGQLRAADDAHDEMLKSLEHAREMAFEAEVSRQHTLAVNEELVEKAKTLLAHAIELRKAVHSMPALTSSKGSNAIAAPSSTNGDESLSAQTDFDPANADMDATLAALRAFDSASAHSVVRAKLDGLATLVRKWQKAYKSASEKTNKANALAREKIAFRNFQTGDLALFLPTRNSTAKPWAAFNISFPHYFLHATGVLAEQLKTKEWIVARITTITDRVADSKDPVGNPFQLADGVRFYLLDVEGWNNPATAVIGSRSRRVSTPNPAPQPQAETSEPPTSPPELQRSESFPHASSRMIRRSVSEGVRQVQVAGISTSIEEEGARSISPPVATPDASPTRKSEATKSEQATPTAAIRVEQATPPRSTETRASSPSGITRALRASSRAASPVASRYEPGVGRPWPTTPLESSNKPHGIIEAAAPAFGKGKGKKRLEPSVDVASEAVSNPFSQSPGPSSLPGHDYFGRANGGRAVSGTPFGSLLRPSASSAPSEAVIVSPGSPRKAAKSPPREIRRSATSSSSISSVAARGWARGMVTVKGSSLMLGTSPASVSASTSPAQAQGEHAGVRRGSFDDAGSTTSSVGVGVAPTTSGSARRPSAFGAAMKLGRSASRKWGSSERMSSSPPAPAPQRAGAGTEAFLAHTLGRAATGGRGRRGGGAGSETGSMSEEASLAGSEGSAASEMLRRLSEAPGRGGSHA